MNKLFMLILSLYIIVSLIIFFNCKTKNNNGEIYKFNHIHRGKSLICPPIISSAPVQSTVVIYAYHCKPDSTREVENLRFLIDHGNIEAITMVLVSNGSEIPQFVPHHVYKLRRENRGYDFEAWYHGLRLAQSIHPFEKFVFINSSCKGPYLPRWFSTANMHWTECFTRLINAETKLVGLTVNNVGSQGEQAKHVQSMLWATDGTGIDILLKRKILEEHSDLDFKQMIAHKEIGMSRVFLDANFRIVSLGMSDCVSDRHDDLHYNDKWFGSTLNPFETIFIKNNRLSSKYIDYLDMVHKNMERPSQKMDDGYKRKFRY